MTKGRRVLGVVGMATAVVLVACAAKVSKVGGESHFSCESDDDCPPFVPVCVRASDAAARGTCHTGGGFGSGGRPGLLEAGTGNISASAGGGRPGVPEAGPGTAGARGAGGTDSGVGATGSNAGGSGGRDTVDSGNAGTAQGGSAGAQSVAADSPCSAACCPSDAACYSTGLGKTSPGAVCLATRDNTAQQHIQLRQTWMHSVAPTGFTIPIVYGVYSGRSELPLNGKSGNQDCHMGNGPLGAGGFIELIDLSADVATIGYARFVSSSSVQADLRDGLCMGSGSFAGDAKYRLRGSDIAEASWSAVLPAPRGLSDAAWAIAPVRAKALASDFDVTRDRLDLLAKLSAGGELRNAGFTGVFFYDAAAGYLHTFAPVSWEVRYGADSTSFTVAPLREVEKRMTFNDPTHPNCVGVYGADPAMTVASGCKGPGDPKAGAAWGGGNCKQSTGNPRCGAGEGPARTTAYALISELQQVYDTDLGITDCVFFPSEQVSQADGFYDDATKGCITSKWDPKAAKNSGLPHGDWCAATNSPATADCHDAFRLNEFQTFSGTKIQLAGSEPAQCAF